MKPITTPHHVALIPDGNRRWAKKKGLPTFEGHRRGFQQVKKLSKKVRELGITVFTVWAFSTENWNRAKEEVNYLMKIYEQWIDENLKEAIKDNVRIIHIGRKDRIPELLRGKLQNAEDKTQKLRKHYFVIALDYGGHDEILRAVEKGKKIESKISEEQFETLLDTRDIPYPNPDLIIRTSGEQRSSGFMPWQSAYAEYLFVKKHLPDFTPEDFKKCIDEYLRRKRRFGK